MQTRFNVFICLLISVTTIVADFNLTILHTNDVHARIEESDKLGGPCSPELLASNDCYGGASRIRTMVNLKRKQYANRVLLLDAGDQFQGTLWYYVFGGNVSAEFMNLIGYDAMAIGNHEFDGGIKGLAPFAHSINFPLLSSNINLINTPDLSSVVNKSTIITVGNTPVGIVGYTTIETPDISFPETAIFTDELGPIQAEVDILVAKGIKIIIALGHSGYAADIELAKRLNNVDIIVGGHTNTFLYSGEDPSNEKAQGKYPTLVDGIQGRKVLVVQDYAFAKYLGELHVTFNDDGEAIAWSGNPILLDHSVAKDDATEQLVARHLPAIEHMKKTVIGETYVDLIADRIQCRTTECNLGNLIADSIVHQNLKRQSDPNSWSDVSIGLVNAGSFRASILKGNITIEQVIYVQPFRNTIDLIEISGKTLVDMLEFSASKWNTVLGETFGGFLQVSGLQITFDIDRPIGERVVEVLVLCTKCLVPKLEFLDLNKAYKVLITSYISKGGERYSMLPGAIISSHAIGDLDTDLLLKYVKAHSPITTGLQNRIRHLKDIQTLRVCGGGIQPLPSLATKFLIPLICFLIIYTV
uniref:5'-nucleotidase n=1 Tax=Arion vulgaris TaxID=1028688 RepID=A0A0B6ZWT7_9EUPU